MSLKEGKYKSRTVNGCSSLSSSHSQWPGANSVNAWLCTMQGREFDSSAVSNQFKTNLEDVTKRLDEFQATATSTYSGERDFV